MLELPVSQGKEVLQVKYKGVTPNGEVLLNTDSGQYEVYTSSMSCICCVQDADLAIAIAYACKRILYPEHETDAIAFLEEAQAHLNYERKE